MPSFSALKMTYAPLLDRAALRARAAVEQMADDMRVFSASATAVTTDDLELLGYTVALVPVSCLLYPLGVAGALYLSVAVVLGAVFLGMTGWGVWRKEGKVWARKVFLFTLVYLAGLFGALMANGTVR